MTTYKPPQDLYWPAKDPDAELDHVLDWSGWLAGDTIASAEWIAPAGIETSRHSITATAASLWIKGGTSGTTYSLVCRIVTAGGRTNDQTVKLPVRNR